MNNLSTTNFVWIIHLLHSRRGIIHTRTYLLNHRNTFYLVQLYGLSYFCRENFNIFIWRVAYILYNQRDDQSKAIPPQIEAPNKEWIHDQSSDNHKSSDIQERFTLE